MSRRDAAVRRGIGREMIVRLYLLLLIGLWTAVGAFGACAAQDTATASTEAAAPLFAHETNPYGLAPDPAFHFLRLETGLRVVLIPNATPPREVTVAMRVLAGALDEPEDKAGLAHLLEHLAFQGSRRSDEPVFTRLERLGIRAGADANGSTTATRTEYSFRLPDNDPAKVRQLIAVLRDIADGLLLKPDTIEQERAVVSQERVDRDSAQIRFVYALYRSLVPGAEVGRHPVSGTAESITRITREDLLAFYEAYYRPENIVLVVAGDLPLETMEKLVREAFGDFRRSGRPPRRPVEPERPVPLALRAGHFVSPDITPAVLLFSHLPLADWALADPAYSGIHAPKVTPDKRAQALEAALLREVAWQAASYTFSLRIQKLQFTADPGFAAAGLGAFPVPRAARFGNLTVIPQKDDWQRAMRVGARELQRLLVHGITRRELDQALATFAERLKRAASQADTRPSPALAAAALESVSDHRVPRAPADALADFNRVRDKITPEDVLKEVRRRFAGRAQVVFLRTREPVAADKGKEDTTVLLAWRKAVQNADAALAQEARKTGETTSEAQDGKEGDGFPYDRFGPPQTPVEVTRVKNWDFETWRYPNHLVVHVKHSELERDKVRFIAHLGEGVKGVPGDKPGLTLAGATLTIFGGLGKMDYPALVPLLNRTGVAISGRFDDRGFVLTGQASRAEFPFAMRYLAAILADAGYRPSGMALVNRILEQQYTVFNHSPNGVYLLHGLPKLFGGDSRFVPLPARFADLAAITPEDVSGFMRPLLGSEFLELSIVGDIAPEAVREALAETVAALPERAAAPSRLVYLPAPWNGEGRTVRLTYAGKDVGSRVVLSYPLLRAHSRRQAVAFDILAAALAITARERVREDAGLSYSPSAQAQLDRRAGYRGVLQLAGDGPSGASEKVAASLADLLHELAGRTMDADLLRRAKEPVLKQIEKIRDTNASWLMTVLDGLARDPDRLHRLETARALVAATDAEAIRQAAEMVLAEAPHPWRFLIEPESPAPTPDRRTP